MPVSKAFVESVTKDVTAILSELRRLCSKPYQALSVDEKYSIRYHVIILAESIASLCVHVSIEDVGYEPKSSIDCIRMLGLKGIITCGEDLAKLIRLRNLLVHRYWVIDDEKVYQAIKHDFRCVEEFISKMRERYLAE